jgi:hypothetical protein
MGEKRNAYKAVVGKAEGKIPLVRPRATWEDNVACLLKARIVKPAEPFPSNSFTILAFSRHATLLPP